ncbi:MAG: hypothetical protein ACFFB3_24300 [Candidatus Hodarchaeota archaeon]
MGFGEQYLSDKARQNLACGQREPLYALQELTTALGTLKSLVLEKKLYCLLLTSLALRSTTKSLGGSFLAHSAGIIVQNRQKEDETVWELLSHPARAQHTIRRDNQRGYSLPQRLDSFLQAKPASSIQEWVHPIKKQVQRPTRRSLDAYLSN